MKADVQKEHRWFEQLVGEWTTETEAPAGPDHPGMNDTGTESARLLGGVWLVSEGRSGMPDGEPVTTLMMLGYDPAKGRYIGSFIGTMGTHMWHYEGELDATGKVLSLDTEGPSFTTKGKTSKYRDVIEIKSDDHRVMTSSYLDDEGKWHQFMTMSFRRKK